ncbi:hypothetical protein E2553_43060 [Paraburkholderia dipogonis]|uniref:EthD domain-containing protein n=1 Tax=Paraburkholderia dipogonis TaxID=1211383 RepID=A0A4Y8MGF3_9BURK|nr:hypothetical protein [Paraburkholderia dipogonis]TFE36517.1 hypothetical protein E2553_43060 [Paraburkholderia dipogonis]
MRKPERVTSMCSLVWLRSDLAREDAQAYWRGPHAEIANKVRAINEYLQHHFSASDHGFWPVPKEVGGAIPADWRVDGMAEVRIRSMAAGLFSRLFHMKAVFHDEFNVFDRVLANNSRPGGGRWWTGAHQPDIGFRAAVLIRARHEEKGAPFRRFVEEALAPALIEAGAVELRTHVFQPGGRFIHWTPDVRHDQPVNRAYAGALIVGTRTRAEFDCLMKSPFLLATHADQRRYCVAIHAYAVEKTYAGVLDNNPQQMTLKEVT